MYYPIELKKQQGFTLIELMIVVGLVAVLAGLAAPQFQTTIQNNRLVTTTNELRGAISFARSEAVKRGSSVVFESTGGTTDWSAGWQVKAGNDIIREWEALHSDMKLTVAPGGKASLKFNSQGMVDKGQTWIICDARAGAGNTAQRVELILSGMSASGGRSSSCS